MTKHKNSGQRTPQGEKSRLDPSRKNHTDSTTKPIAGTTSAPGHQESQPAPTFTAMELPAATPQATTVVPSNEDPQCTLFTTPNQTAVNNSVPPGAPPRNRRISQEEGTVALEEDTREATLKKFVSQNFEMLNDLIREESRRRIDTNPNPQLNFNENSPPRYEERAYNGKRADLRARLGTPADSQYSGSYGDSEKRASVHTRLGRRSVRDRIGRRCSPSEDSSRSGYRRIRDRRASPDGSPTGSDSEGTQRKRRRRSDSLNSSSDNEDSETGHWKSKGRRRKDEGDDISRPWRRQTVDAFTKRISDYSDRKKRRLPANVKTYDGTGDPDDHLKVFETAASIEYWPEPVWCHMFNSTLVGNARDRAESQL